MNQKLLKSQTILAICILILSIIPIVAIGPYLHQFADDYVFGAPVYKAWTATHSLGACIQAAWDESMHIYQTWQGTYSACFLMALQPGIFGKYWLVPIILLGGFGSFHLYPGLYSITQVATYQQAGVRFRFYAVRIDDRTVRMVVLRCILLV